MIDINGIAHIQLTVRSVERSRSFYHRILHETFGMTIQYDGPGVFYCIGGRTGVAIAPVAPELSEETFNQRRLGVHHLCFRARSREDVDAIYQTALALKVKIVRAPREDSWAPGYYSVLFEDPDGIRLEANFVPGKGHLENR